MVDHRPVARAEVPGDQRRPGDGHPRAERDHQEHERKADRDRSNRVPAQAADPEGVRELIRALENGCQDDRNRELEE